MERLVEDARAIVDRMRENASITDTRTHNAIDLMERAILKIYQNHLKKVRADSRFSHPPQ